MKLKVKKPTKIWNKKLKFSFKGFFNTITKSAISFWNLSPYKGLKDLVDLIKSIELEKDPSGTAYQLILISIINAVHEVIEENKSKLNNELSELEKIYDSKSYIELLTDIESVLENSDTVITDTWFSNPVSIKVFSNFKAVFKKWLILFGITNNQANIIVSRLDTYFIWNLHFEWKSNHGRYQIIFNELNTPFTKASLREIQWLTYNSFLTKQIKEPVFDEAFGIEEIYIPLRAYMIKEDKNKIIKYGDSESFKEEKIICEVASFLHEWVESPTDSLKVISGGPGSGKSTLAKILASKLSELNKIHVLYVPLQHFNINKNLLEGLSEYLHFQGILNFNPLDEIHSLSKKVLLIFDGLDELSKQGTLAKEVAKEFIQELNNKLNLINSSKTKLLILVTGRVLSIQDQSKSFNQKNQILNLLPFYVPVSEQKNYVDVNSLLKTDQRNLWWEKFSSLKQIKNKRLPNSLKIRPLEEITSQPLLSYLIALSFLRNKIDFNENTNLNEIYSDLIKSVYSRKYEKQQHSVLNELQISENNFLRILEEIAMAAWQNGEIRTTTIGKINSHIKSNKLTSLFSEFQKGVQAGVTRLLTAFYFRQKGLDSLQEKSFEFTHKSFGEYLVSRRVISILELSQRKILAHYDNPDDGWDTSDTLKKWIESTGLNTIDNYILEYLKNELKLVSIDIVIKYQNTLICLINYLLKHGTPVELLSPRAKTYNEEHQISINVEENILALLYCCTSITKKHAKINWPKEESLGNWMLKLNPQKKKSTQTISVKRREKKVNAKFYLANMIIENQSLAGLDLTSVNFSNCILKNLVFAGSDLWGASFKNSLIENCNFYRCSVASANFSHVEFKYGKEFLNPSISIEQLFTSKTLYEVKGIPDKVRNKMLESNGKIFDNIIPFKQSPINKLNWISNRKKL